MKKRLILTHLLIAVCVNFLNAQTSGDTPVLRKGAAIDSIVPPSAKVEKLKGGFKFAEGPVWVQEGTSGYLLFSDIPANVIHKWTPDGELSVFLARSGYTGSADADAAGIGAVGSNGTTERIVLMGSNGITLDAQRRIVFVAHGDRAVVRLERDGKRTVLADRFEGKRLNSPNDLVYKTNGSLYFTDHIAGLREREKDPDKQLPFQAVFLLKGGKLEAVAKDMGLPNGLALSPDQKVLYVAGRNQRNESVVMAYDVKADDTVGTGRVFVDMSTDKSPGGADGMKVDQKGNLYATGPGGVWVISPQGQHLGTIQVPEAPANVAFGDLDGKSLYITARTGLYRIRTSIPGIRP